MNKVVLYLISNVVDGHESSCRRNIRDDMMKVGPCVFMTSQTFTSGINRCEVICVLFQPKVQLATIHQGASETLQIKSIIFRFHYRAIYTVVGLAQNGENYIFHVIDVPQFLSERRSQTYQHLELSRRRGLRHSQHP